MKKAIWVLCLAGAAFSLRADESWLIPKDDLFYQQAEELFLSAWLAPPLEELPLSAGEAKRRLDRLRAATGDPLLRERASSLLGTLPLDQDIVRFHLTSGISLRSTTETDRYHFIQTYNREGATPVLDTAFLDYNSLYQLADVPPLYALNVMLQALGLSLQAQTDLAASYSFLLSNPSTFNFPSRWQAFSVAIPSRAVLSLYKDPFEFRIGRDGLRLGPGAWGSLVLNSRIPYFDFLKARLFIDTAFSLSLYIINLDPIISAAESKYLDDMYSGIIPNPEINADQNGKPFIGLSKNLVLSRLTVSPFPWLSLSVTQNNLVGGRDLTLTDVIPLNIFHNLFAEGVYSCPLAVSAVLVPYQGVKLYGEFYLQDLVAGDETDPTVNPNAAGYQAGLVLLSTPFFSIGPGRFRLNAEWAWVDPWVYVRYYSIRKFTSRIVYYDPEAGSLWIDYPLGYYLGPDVMDVNASLSYGVPGAWEVELWWNLAGQGSIDLYGWGEDSDFSHVGESGYPLLGAPTETAQWTNRFRLSAYLQATPRLKISAWYMVTYVINRYHVPGDNHFFHAFGVRLDCALF